MDRVMVRVSSSKNTFSTRFSPARSYAVSAIPSQPSFSFQTFIYLLLALCGAFLVAHFVFTASESSRALRSSLRSVPAEAILHAQLIEKEREIEKLKWEIDHIRKGTDVKESNINEQEDVIQQLKTKARIEHEAKTKAELALSDRAGALHECQQQKTALAGEVAQCHFDLQALLGAGGRAGLSMTSAARTSAATSRVAGGGNAGGAGGVALPARTVSQQSSKALGEMERRRQELMSSTGGGVAAAEGAAGMAAVGGRPAAGPGGEDDVL